MRLILVLYVLSAYSPSVRSDVVLTESGGDVKKSGGMLRLTCKGSQYRFSGNWMHWVRQPPGRGLEWVARINPDGSTRYYSPSVQGRFTISRDNPQNLFYLDMTSLKSEDTALYYCTRDVTGGATLMDFWGQGTMVTVTSGTPSAPSLFPIHPCCDAITSLSSLEIGCFVTADSPSSRIEWFPDSGSSPISSGVKSYPAVYNNGRYSLSSVLKVSTSDWNSKSYQCKVDQLRKPLKPVEPVCDTISDPKIELYMASCESSDIDSRYLLCIITDFSPDDIEVAWFKGRGTPITNFIKADNSSKGKDGKFSTKSKLLLNKDEWNMGTVYTCTVTHLTSGKRFSKKITACLACPEPKPHIEIMKPSTEDLISKKASTITCRVTSSQRKVTAAWKINGMDGPTEWKEKYFKEKREWILTSQLKVSASEWDTNQYTCEATHPCYNVTEKQEIKKSIDSNIQKKKPSLAILGPFFDASSDSNTLIATIFGFYPEDILVMWEVNGKSPDTKFFNSPVVFDAVNKSYSLQSILSIPTAKVKIGADYTCKVGHETLESMTGKTKEDPFAPPTPAPTPVPTAPTVGISQPSADEKDHHLVNIVCIAYGFSPKDIEISWQSLQNTTKLKYTTYPSERGESGTYSIKSQLTILKEDWSEGIYSCEVYHKATNTRIIQNTTNSKSDCHAYTPEPTIYPIKPSYEDIMLKKKTNLTCLVVGYELDGINITWTVDDQIVTDGVYIGKLQLHPNGTDTVRGTLEISADYWLSGKTFRYKVTHTSLPTPREGELRYVPGDARKTKSPNVNIRLPSSEEIAKEEDPTLICLVENFYPNDVFVQWMEGDSKINPSNYTISDVHFDQATASYSLDSKLKVDRNLWKEGVSYTCMVGHVSLTWMISRTANIHTGKPTLVNLTINLADGQRECQL